MNPAQSVNVEAIEYTKLYWRYLWGPWMDRQEVGVMKEKATGSAVILFENQVCADG